MCALSYFQDVPPASFRFPTFCFRDNRDDVHSYLAAPHIALELRRCGMRCVCSACPQAGGVVIMVARWSFSVQCVRQPQAIFLLDINFTVRPARRYLPLRASLGTRDILLSHAACKRKSNYYHHIHKQPFPFGRTGRQTHHPITTISSLSPSSAGGASRLPHRSGCFRSRNHADANQLFAEAVSIFFR